MNNKNTIIIFDWDDTIFPTSWVVKNKIDLNDESVKNKYIVFFSQLDNLLYDLIIKALECGKIYIVTNAMVKWIHISADIIPNTKKLILNNTEILSAREIYGKTMPGDMFGWKRLIFIDIIKKYYKDKENEFQNIISIGDADYEFEATTNLWSKKSRNRTLKTIKFMTSPTFDSLMDQLHVLSSSMNNICTNTKHLDLRFANVKQKY